MLNPGSIGQPRDGDWRGSYAIVEDGHVQFRRFEYDVEATLQEIRDSGITGEALQTAENALRQGGKTLLQQTAWNPVLAERAM